MTSCRRPSRVFDNPPMLITGSLAALGDTRRDDRSSRTPLPSSPSRGGVASLPRWVEHRLRDRRPAILLGEDQRVERFGPVAAPRLGGDEPLGWRDLSIHAAHPHLGAVGTAPDEVPRSARTEVDLADRQGPATRTQHPVRRVLGLGPRLEDEPARRVHDARHDDLPIRRRRERRRAGFMCRAHRDRLLWASTTDFISFSPFSQLPPIIVSMSPNRCITLATKLTLPAIL